MLSVRQEEGIGFVAMFGHKLESHVGDIGYTADEIGAVITDEEIPDEVYLAVPFPVINITGGMRRVPCETG